MSRPRCSCGSEATHELDTTISPLKEYPGGRWAGDWMMAIASIHVPLCTSCAGEMVKVEKIEVKIAMPQGVATS